ncbi:NarK family nitrate/nitrite MFS transporter [Natronosporangium hydrolyticum]|uniref:Nitrate/nitrite transporter n=1 Tax=Natronosporangium hydrolyticum TaxID=2811111 RepID=A0A895YMG9_9ACTN|nr:NarK family nitrate/nitrite MFS transporter [Natronosporangium hydrolyticum]QSB17165.1 NarK family nitrate/nitrite MFS transporter [Natronosporangium hydrolyticum]
MVRPHQEDLLGRRPGRWITNWDPEDEGFWARTGRRIANRNLIFSIFAEHLGFSVWLLWSVIVVSLPAAGFTFSVSQLFWLVALPNLIGGLMRFPYTFAVPKFGGRNWTVVSALLLVIPLGLLIYCVTDPTTPYWMFLVAAATAGLGGGNFASSMANISFFYPERRKGLALGLNAAGGNIGVSVVQFVVPIVIVIGVAGGAVRLEYAAYVWLPLVLISAVCAWRWMDNLSTARSNFRDQVVVAKREHTWVMSVLYIGTFGSFIGYSAAFPLLINTQFPELSAIGLAFLGPLVGSVSRPLGGWLSDHLGGARVTLWTFLTMCVGVIGVWQALQVHSFPLFLGAFLLLFVTTGVGNGSTYRMIPSIFRAQALLRVDYTDPEARAGALAKARREGAAVLGFTSAIGALGGFLIPQGFGTSISATGGVGTALTCFLAFYLVCSVLTWGYYLRRSGLSAQLPALSMRAI